MHELVAVAEALGAPVITESGTTHGRLAFPSDHPLNAGGLPLWSPEVRERLDEYDVVLVVGMDLLRQYIYFEPARAIPEHVRLVQIDEDPWQIGKNYPVEVGVIGDTKTSLAELHALLDSRRSTPTHVAQVRERRRAPRRQARCRPRATAAADRRQREGIRPLTPLGLMGACAKVLPPDVAVIEEAVTTTNTTFERLGVLKNTTGYFGHRGWALGWGLGVSIGVKLAWPERPVLALLGEGAAAYGMQGLWSAAQLQGPRRVRHLQQRPVSDPQALRPQPQPARGRRRAVRRRRSRRPRAGLPVSRPRLRRRSPPHHRARRAGRPSQRRLPRR